MPVVTVTLSITVEVADEGVRQVKEALENFEMHDRRRLRGLSPLLTPADLLPVSLSGAREFAIKLVQSE